MTPQPLKIRADIEMKCFQFDGVLHIKVQFAFLALPSFPVDSVRELDHVYCGQNFQFHDAFLYYKSYPLTLQDAMRKAEAAGNADCPVKIKLVAPPLYVLTTQTLDKVSLILGTLLG